VRGPPGARPEVGRPAAPALAPAGEVARSRVLGVAALVLAAGCATSQRVPRAAVPEQLDHLRAAPMEEPVSIGLARVEGGQLYRESVSRGAVVDLRLAGRILQWRDADTGAARHAPFDALAWLEWRTPGTPRWVDLLVGAGLGLLAGAAVGTGASAAILRDTCVGGVAIQGVGVFARRCFPGWVSQLGLWVPIGGGLGGLGGGLLGWLLGHHQRWEVQADATP
jgi:hypothetical protein